MSARDLITRPLAHDDSILAAIFIPSNEIHPSPLLVTAGHDDSIKIWEINEISPTLTKPLFIVKHSSLSCTSLTSSITCQYQSQTTAAQSNSHSQSSQSLSLVWSSHLDGTIHSINVLTGEIVHTLFAGVGLTYSIVHHTNKNLLFTCSPDGSIHSLQTPDNSTINLDKIFISQNQLNKQELSKQSQSILESHRIYSSNQVRTLNSNQLEKFITCIKMSYNGKYLITGQSNGKILLWKESEKADWECLGEFLGSHRGSVRCATFSHDNKYLYSGGEDGTVLMWDLQTKLLLSLINTNNNNSWITAIIVNKQQIINLNPSNSLLIISSLSKEISIYDTIKKEFIQNLEKNKSSVWTMTNLNSLLAIGSEDGSLRLAHLPVT